MFFDDATPKKQNLKPKLRLAGNPYAHDSALKTSGPNTASARERLENARFRKEEATSLLDRIDAIDRAHETALAARNEELQAERLARPVDRDTQDHRLQQDRQDTNDTNYRIHQTAPIDQGSTAPLVHPIYVINAVRKWRNVILATTILGGLVGISVALTTPKLYYSSTGILIDPRNFKVVENDINPDVFLSEASLAIVDSQLNIIRSPTVIDKVVTQLSLESKSEFNGTKKGLLSPLTDFFSIITGRKSADANVGAAIKNLNKKTEATRQAGTFVINIGAYSEDPELAALIANTYVDVYMAERANDRTSTAARTSNSMQARLPELKKQVEVAESKAAKFKAENDLFDAQGRLIDDEALLRLNDQLTSARSTTITLNARADSAKSVTVDGLLAGGLPEEINSNALNSLRAQYTTAKQRYDGLLTKLGPMHPDLRQAANESESLRASIDAEIKRIRSSIQTDLRRAVQAEQALAASLAQMKVGLTESGDALVKLREIEREAASARTVYEQFLLRAQETGEQGTIDSTNVKRTNIAKASQDSVSTSRKLLVVGGIIGGFLLGLAFAILSGILDALKVQYGGNFDASRPRPPAPRPSSGPANRSIRGVFQPNESQNVSSSRSQGQWSQQTAQAHYNEQSEVSIPQVQVHAITPEVSRVPAPIAAAVTPQPPQFAPVQMQQPMQMPILQQQMPMYVPQQPVFMPQVQQPWFYPQSVMMPQMMPQPMIPQMMMQQPLWQPQPQPAQQFAAPEPQMPVADKQPLHVVRQHKTSQNPQLDDIQESLADMKAELLNIARQRRHG